MKLKNDRLSSGKYKWVVEMTRAVFAADTLKTVKIDFALAISISLHGDFHSL